MASHAASADLFSPITLSVYSTTHALAPVEPKV
jgi:hypothetical protein